MNDATQIISKPPVKQPVYNDDATQLILPPLRKVQIEDDATQIIIPRNNKQVSSEELHVSNVSSNNNHMIDPTVIINLPNRKKPSEIEQMLKEDDSESSSSDGGASLSQSPKFGQRQYSQRGTVLKRPVDMHDSMGDIMDELDGNKKQPNGLQQILEAKSEESSQERKKSMQADNIKGSKQN